MRREVEGRLLVVACCGLIVGIAGIVHPWNLLLLLPLLFFVRPPGAKAVAAVACLVGALVAPRVDVRPVEHREFYKGVVTVETVPKPTKYGLSCEVSDTASRMTMSYKDDGIGLGDRLRVQGVVDPPFETEEAFLASREIVGRLRPAELIVVGRGPALHRFAAETRNRFRDFTGRTLNPRSAAAVDALCFNVDADLDKDFKLNLSRTGTIHIISASGMHVVIVAFAVLWLLGRLPLPRWLQLLVLSAILLFYASAAGLRPPMVRSVIMAMIVLTAYLWRREVDWLSAMAFAALGYLVFSPASLFDVGYQLSFVAVASLGLFGRYWAGGVLQKLKTAGHASFVASVGSAPLVAYHFGMFSVVAVVANVLIELVVAPIVILAMAAALIPFAPLADGIMSWTVEPLSGWLMGVVDTMGPWRLSAVDTPAFSAYWLLPIYGAMLLLWRRRPIEA